MQIYLIAFCFLLLNGCAQAGFPIDAKRDLEQMVLPGEAERIDRENMALILSRIQEFERRAGKSSCVVKRFEGFDNAHDSAPVETMRVKAIALSTCGPIYYWLTLYKENLRLTVMNVEHRSPVAGDKVYLPLPDGRWNVVDKK